MPLLVCGLICGSLAGVSLTQAQTTPQAKKPVAKTAAKPKPVARAVAHPPAKTAVKVAAKKTPAPRAVVASRPKATGMEWVRSLQTWLYPIKISPNAGGITLVETRGLGVENNFIILPLDSVLSAWLSRSDLRFFVNDSTEAHVADLDLASNIAILKVDSPLPATLNRNQIRSELPATGESMAAAESRDAIHGGPRFVGTTRDGESIRYLFQRNGTLENGGFIFDRTGNLVSVVPALRNTGDDQRIWASSTQSIVELLHRQDGPKPASVSGVEERHNQLVTWQEHWTRAFVTSPKLVSAQNLNCETNLASISDASIASKIRQMNSMNCESKTSIPLGAGYSGGLELKTGNVVLRSPSLNDNEGLQLAKTFGSSYFDDLAKRSTQVNLLTVQDCHESSVVNQKGAMVHVRFCTSALKTDKGLSDTVVALSSVDAGSHAYVVAARMKGFDQNNTKKVIEALIENGESLK